MTCTPEKTPYFSSLYGKWKVLLSFSDQAKGLLFPVKMFVIQPKVERDINIFQPRGSEKRL